MASTYEPIGEETLELADEIVPVKPRRKRKHSTASRSSGPGRVVAIVALVVLLMAIVACAIALPIVLTRKTQQNALRNADLSVNPNAANGGAGRSGSAAASSSAGGSASNSASTQQSGNGNSGAASGGANPGSAFAVAPVSPDRNTGSNVYCYRSPSTGEMLPGAFLLTGESSNEDGIQRSQVQSCGTGSKMYLSSSQLVLCKTPCLTPSWMAVENGMIAPPIWNQQYVCRGDQVYENRLTPRYSFYWRYAGFVQEQLITRCDSDDAWWIPNIELRFCQEQEIVACQVSSLNRAKSRGSPVVLHNVPSGTSQKPRPVCRLRGSKIDAFWATGVSVNKYVWTRVRFMDMAEVTECADRNGKKKFIFVDDIVPCPPQIASGCSAASSLSTKP